MKKYIILLCVLLLGTSVFAEDFNTYRAKNGQLIIIKQVSSNPVVIIDTWVKTGSINENDKNTGVSHFLEHLFFKGTANTPTGEFDRILEAKGAITNAATSKDFTHYYIQLPSKDFDLALKLHADMLLNPAIPQAEMDRERKVVIEEIAKDKNSPSDIVYDNLNELIYKVHPYKREVIGTAEVISTITRDEVLDYYKKNYSPKNMITIVVGDVEPDKTAKKVMEAFDVKRTKLERHHYKKEPKITTQRTKEVTFPSNSAYMRIGFRGTNAVHNDEFALDILSTILSDGKTSRFYKNIKDKKQLVTSISSANISGKDDGTFQIGANFLPENKEEVIKEIFAEIKNVQKNGITQEELDRAKKMTQISSHYSRESIANISTEMGYTVVLTGSPKEYNNYLKKINKVTAKDVKRVANKYLNENQSAISVVLPDTYKAQPKSEIKKTTHKADLVKSAYNTDKYTLDTGAILLVNKHKNNDIVAISVRVKGGAFVEKMYGVSNLTASAMTKGTKSYNAEEFAKITEENGIEMVPSVCDDYFKLDVVTTKEQLPLTLSLLNEVVKNATFDNNEINKIKTNMLQNIKASRDIPFTKASEEYSNNIFAGSVYSCGKKTLENNIPKITRNDILDYYKNAFYPKNIVISVNGDVDSQNIIDEMSEIFNSKNGKEFNYSNYKNAIPKRTTIKKILIPVKDLQTSWILLGWQTDGVTNIKDFSTLLVIDSFMGTGMSSRLFRALREQKGLAYQVGSGFSPNVLRGKYTMYIGTNPKNVKMATDGMLKQIEILKTKTVSEKELQEAKDKLIGKYVMALETNLDKSGALAMYEITGRGFDFVDKYADLIQAVTAKDVKDVANKYFLNNYVESVVDKAK